MRRAGGQPPSDVGDDLAQWPGSADVQQQSAQRSGATCNPCLLAVVRKSEGGSRRGVERSRRSGAADRGGDSAERGDVSRGGKKNGGGSEGWHARRMPPGVPLSAIAPTRA